MLVALDLHPGAYCEGAVFLFQSGLCRHPYHSATHLPFTYKPCRQAFDLTTEFNIWSVAVIVGVVISRMFCGLLLLHFDLVCEDRVVRSEVTFHLHEGPDGGYAIFHFDVGCCRDFDRSPTYLPGTDEPVRR